VSKHAYLDVSDGNGTWKNLVKEPLLSSRFKLQQNVDGTFGIFSVFKVLRNIKIIDKNGISPIFKVF
jgi:hypothetical protein